MTASHVRSVTIRVLVLNLEVSEVNGVIPKKVRPKKVRPKYSAEGIRLADPWFSIVRESEETELLQRKSVRRKSVRNTPLKGSDWTIRGSQLFENLEKRNYSEESPFFWRDEAAPMLPARRSLIGQAAPSDSLWIWFLIGRGNCSPASCDW